MLLKNLKDADRKNFNVCIVGNSTLDTIEINKSMTISRGGAVTYIFPWLTTILPNSKIYIYSSGPSDCLDHLITNNNTTMHIDIDKKLAHFKLVYYNQSRKIELLQEPHEIFFNFFITNKPENDPDIILICPIYNEIKNEFVNKLKKLYPSSFISIQAQGFVRTKNNKNQVIINNWIPSKEFIESINIIILSYEDLSSQLLDSILQYNQIKRIITIGSKGAILLSEDVSIRNNLLIPAFSIEKKENFDSTGAGDVFYICTTIFYFLTKNIKKSILGGHLLAKFHLESQFSSQYSRRIFTNFEKLNQYINTNFKHSNITFNFLDNEEIKKYF